MQLPQRVIALPPQNGSQARLLWGLMRTVWPLLGSDLGMRDWSFSTFEPPLGDVDTGALPDIVFRTQQTVRPALSMRREILVRPQEPTEPRASIQHQDFARLLVDAYHYMGGNHLGQHLDAVGGDYPSVDTRIEGVQATLCEVLPAEALSLPSQQYVKVAGPELPEPEELLLAEDLAPAQDAASASDIGWPEDAVPSESIPPSPSAPAAHYSDTAAQPPSPAEPQPPITPPIWTQRTSALPLGASNRAREDAPQPPRSAPRPTTTASPSPAVASRPPTTGSRREQAGAAAPHTVSGLVDQLYHGPGDPGFESALQFLRAWQVPRPAVRPCRGPPVDYKPRLVHPCSPAVRQAAR